MSPLRSVLREIRAHSDRFLDEASQLMPRGGGVAIGGAHMDPFIRGEALAKFLSAVNRGATPDEAAEAAREEARFIVGRWNDQRSRISCAIMGASTLRYEGAADGVIEEARRAVASVLEEAAP